MAVKDHLSVSWKVDEPLPIVLAYSTLMYDFNRYSHLGSPAAESNTSVGAGTRRSVLVLL